LTTIFGNGLETLNGYLFNPTGKCCTATGFRYNDDPCPVPKDLNKNSLPPGAYVILPDNHQHKGEPYGHGQEPVGSD
jgi:hypothetical protein